MSDTQPTQVKLFEVAELPGRPMLHWHGKLPLREIPYYPVQLRERYGHAPSPPQGEGWGEGGSEGWANRLYWGDNLQVMAHLMREFRGKIKLISAQWRRGLTPPHHRYPRRDELVQGEYTWEVEEYGEGRVAVKTVDVLDEEWFGVTEAVDRQRISE